MASSGSPQGQPTWQLRALPTPPAPQARRLSALTQQEHIFVHTSGPAQLSPTLCSVPLAPGVTAEGQISIGGNFTGLEAAALPVAALRLAGFRSFHLCEVQTGFRAEQQ